LQAVVNESTKEQNKRIREGKKKTRKDKARVKTKSPPDWEESKRTGDSLFGIEKSKRFFTDWER